ncbi:MAG TPA: CNNM domain-containing protein, partial [Casimicrobiaceae bacterium]|nr:CNNM domain-containing protein [Casimicrobiaceae bacterium]
MDDIAVSSLLIALALCIVLAGFFSIAETAMMATNRYRLKHRAQRGSRSAKLAMALLAQTDRLLGVILLGNTLVAAAAATLTAVITKRLFGEGEIALSLGTVAISFMLLVFSEITPKVVGAQYADRLAPLVSYVLTPMLKVASPVVWFVNLFVQGLLKLFRFRPPADASTTLTQEELRSLVLEGSQYFRGKHRTMLANLMDLEQISVDDVMTPRAQIHALDIAEKPAVLRQQLATSYHSRLPVYDGSLDNIVGILPVKSVVQLSAGAAEVDAERLRPLLRPPYFVPVGTPLLTQLQQFQVDRQRMGLVVDEYGELQGLVTIEDIVEEIIGEFTTQAPGTTATFRREPDGSVTVDGMMPLRVLNRRLGTQFPLDGPKTLNGLIVEHLGDIPDAGVAFKLENQGIEVLQTQDRAVKVVRLLAPVGRPAAPLQTRS